METDPFFNALTKVVPIAILALLGFVWIYSVVGVPFGIMLLGAATWLAVYEIRKHHHGLPHH